ncbi:hypothetical protein HPB47_003910 [Ixodes persulcatus]|uniref:Uncharacterized protein n=1 Tax=Ixodes persulcatus TaxID=34615 RepID=A0AC60PII4_IXOPE|nr:hypothetical protein HPB47_003910 [Ixodes persulcatus]
MDEASPPLENVKDVQASTEHECVLRANLKDEAAVGEWLEAYGVETNTSWIVQKGQRCNGQPQVIYADTEEKLEAATAQLNCQPHQAFMARVEAFLGRWGEIEEVGVAPPCQLHHAGHNTKNFAEATIRVLKDTVLNRTEAFNAVAT